MAAWAHRSGAGVSSYLHGSSATPGLGVPPFLVWDLHTRLSRSHCLRHIGAPWPSTRWWEGRGLEQLICLKGQPMKDSRSLNAWVQGTWAAGVGLTWVSEQPPAPISSERVGCTCVLRRGLEPCTQETRLSQPSRWSWGKGSSWEAGTTGRSVGDGRLVHPLSREEGPYRLGRDSELCRGASLEERRLNVTSDPFPQPKPPFFPLPTTPAQGEQPYHCPWVASHRPGRTAFQEMEVPWALTRQS